MSDFAFAFFFAMCIMPRGDWFKPFAELRFLAFRFASWASVGVLLEAA